ncbi:FG-GAP repeat domain-containing protein [Actinoplanes teichomyceticus]|nr:VCBS repeat-containing protein [Actinoplanes teichomyceticus]
MTVPALPASAAAPSEVTVIPSDIIEHYATDRVGFAGETGFLHQYTTNDSWLWTRYADGATRTVTALDGLPASYLVRAGGDRIRILADVAGHTVAGALTVLDLGTDSWLHPALPTNAAMLAYFSDTMLIRSRTGPGDLALRKFTGDGSPVTVPVTGVPADATGLNSGIVTAPDATATTIGFRGSTDGVGWTRYGLLDIATGRLSMMPEVTGTIQVMLSATHVGFRTSGTVQLFERSAVVAGAAGEPAAIAYPSGTSVLLVDGGLLLRSTSNDRVPVRFRSADGTDRQLLPRSQAGADAVVPAPAGALVVGGTDARDWAVQRVTSGGAVPVLAVTRPAVTAGLTVSQGLVRRIRVTTRQGQKSTYEFTNHHLLSGITEPHAAGGTLTNASACAPDAHCVRTVDGNRYGTAWVSAGTTSTTVSFKRDAYTSGFDVTLPAGGGSLVDVSDSYAIVNTTTPARQYVIRTGYTDEITARAVTGAALWFDTLWTASAGRIQAKNLTTGATAAALATGSSCTPSELQATGRQVYWSCGADGPAGVYDVARKRNVALPSGRYLLGDGYAVRHDADGALIRHDLGTGDRATLGTFARGALPDDRNITWAVDKYSGNVVHADATGAVHVIDAGVARSRPAVVVTNDGDYAVTFGSDHVWSRYLTLSRPVTAWRATITEAATGAVVATRSGGPTTAEIGIVWDGYLAGRRRATSGLYRIALTTSADGSTGSTGTSTVMVLCGTPKMRGYDCDGMPGVLAVRKDGRAAWQLARRDRTSLWDQGWTEQWDIGTRRSQVSALVPFGDLDNDLDNDLLVRKGDGSLYAYLGFGQAYFGRNRVVKISTGWNRYDALVTSGDLNRDGRPDLLARDAKTGVLYRYYGNGRSFGGRAELGGGYRSYARIVGPGDINGDGRADLLLVSKKGVVYTQYGTGSGTFGKARRIGSGFTAYNAVIGVGDLNQDGRNDLLVRDRAGNLFRLLGTGRGTFAARQRIGTGYQKWAYLF